MSRPLLVFVVFFGVLFLGGFGSLGCGGGDDGNGGDVCDDEALKAMGSSVIATQCRTCHSADLSGVDRQGAPLQNNFDTVADIMTHGERIKFRAEGKTMPPPTRDQLSDAEIEAIKAYVDCDPTAGPME